VTAGRTFAAVEEHPRCEPDEHCITCGDLATVMRVMAIAESESLALCRNVDPAPRGEYEIVDLGLLEELAVGDLVLVHAGSALARLEIEEPAG